MFDSAVYERPINTLQAIMDNSKIGEELTVYEDGDRIVYINGTMSKKYLYAHTNKCVKVPGDYLIGIYDETEKTFIVTGVGSVRDYLIDCEVLNDLNGTPKQLDQVRNYLIELEAKEKVFQ